MRSQNCEKRLIASTRLSVCLSVRTEQLGSHWTDFYEILYFSVSREAVVKIQVSFKSNKDNRYIFDHISLIFLRIKKKFHTNAVETIKTHFIFNDSPHPNQKHAVYEIKRENTVEQAGHRWQYGACAFHARYLRLQTHSQNLEYSLLFHCNNGCTNTTQC